MTTLIQYVIVPVLNENGQLSLALDDDGIPGLWGDTYNWDTEEWEFSDTTDAYNFVIDQLKEGIYT